MKSIDCRNLSCPTPVIQVKKALEEYGEIQVLLNETTPRENITRFAHNRGYDVSEMAAGDDWLLTVTAGSGAGAVSPTGGIEDTVFLITADRLGDGPEELGRLLMKNLIFTLLESGNLPSRMLFLNTGVRLTCAGSELLEALDKLAGMGVEIMSCGLCLDFLGIKDTLRSGGTTNMLTTVETLLSSSRVIRL